MYSSIDELPTQVKNSLSRDDQAFWMSAYNTANTDAGEASKYAWEMCRERPSSFSFSAYASVDDWDIQGERIDINSLMKTMDRYVESGGPISWNHGNYTVGNVWGYERIQKDGRDGVKIYGNLFGGDKGIYDEVRDRFVKGARGFSVAGESGGSSYVCDKEACGRVLRPSEILEIALTPKPANPHATTIDFHEGKGFAKSDDGSIRFTEIEMHQSERECPILRLRKALRNAGIDAHARDDGVFVPFAKSESELRAIGLVGTPTEGGMLLRERDSIMKSLFMEGISKGSITADGRFSDTDLEFFSKACEMGFVEYRDGEYVMSDPLEAFEKAATWKQFGEEGQKAVQESRSNNEPEGPYEWLHTGTHSGSDEAFDPAKFTPIKNFRRVSGNEGAPASIDEIWDYKTDADRDDPEAYPEYVQEGLPSGGLYASHRNDKGYSHWADAYDRNNYGMITSGSGKRNGFSFDLNPEANILHINNSEDYAKLLRESPKWVRNGTYVGVDWESLKDKGIQGVYFSPDFSKWIRGHPDAGVDMNSQRGMDGQLTSDRKLVLNSKGELEDRWGPYEYDYPSDSLVKTPERKDFEDNYLHRKGRVLRLDYDGPDHLIITDPSAIGRNKPYIHNEKISDEEFGKAAKWKEASPEARDYVTDKKLKNTEFLRLTPHPMQSVEEYRNHAGPMGDDTTSNKPYATFYGSKYTPDEDYDSQWQEFAVYNDWGTKDKGEIYTLHPNSRVLVVNTGSEFDELAKKYPLDVDEDRMAYDKHLYESRPDYYAEPQKYLSYEKLAKDYDHIYFPHAHARKDSIQDHRFNNRPILDTNQVITLNDYLADSKTPTRILQREYVPRDQREVRDDRRTDYYQEKEVSPTVLENIPDTPSDKDDDLPEMSASIGKGQGWNARKTDFAQKNIDDVCSYIDKEGRRVSKTPEEMNMSERHRYREFIQERDKAHQEKEEEEKRQLNRNESN